MDPSLARVAIAVVVLAVTVLIAAAAGAAAIFLARQDGATWPSALCRGAMAFGRTLTLEIVVLGGLIALLT
ncbi:hypothetical protein ACWDFR_35580 [Streptomyces sp. 900105755]